MANRPLQSALIGWPLLPAPDAKGQLDYPSLEESVRQSIQVILRTQPGEQLMRPQFGAGLEQFLYEPNTLTTRRRIADLIRQSLERWEQRIFLDRVEVTEVPRRPTLVRVEIAYRLRRTAAAKQIGLTLELEA